MIHNLKYRYIALAILSVLSLKAYSKAYTPANVPNVHLSDSTRYVSNPDGVLSPQAEKRLNVMLGEVWQKTTAEPVVVIIDDMAEGYDDVNFANELFDNWKIGKKDTDNGLLLLIVKNPRRATIRTGYGLEGILPDGLSGSILRSNAVPAFKKGDYDKGTIATVSEIARIMTDPVAAQEIRSKYANNRKENSMSFFKFVLVAGGICGVAMLAMVIYLIISSRGKPEQERYRRLNNVRPMLLFLSFLGLGLPLPAFLICQLMMKRLRDHKRKCPNCGTTMRKLDEATDNDYLTPAQDLEERLNSIDYDVWLCPECGEKDVIPYVNRQSAFTTCPQCGSRTCALSENRIIRRPTTQAEGIGERIYTCRNCGNITRKSYHIAKEAAAPVVILPGGFGGGSGGGFGGGSFGGGSTSGGGASVGW